MGKRSKKAIKEHYNKILKDPERRKKHFQASGALGSEREGRTRQDMIHVRYHNISLDDAQESSDEKLKKLKEKGKIEL